MAFNMSVSKMSEETFEFNCTACAADDIIKEALKYCVDCQQYCCKDCITYHRQIALLKGHNFIDNSSVKPQGQPKSLPAIPTKQCSKHVGMVMLMYCKNHDDVCCYVCAAEDHRSCKDMLSVSDKIDKLYSKAKTTNATSKISYILEDMVRWKDDTDTILQQLQTSKASAIKSVSDCRIEMEKLLKKLEEASIKEIEDEYKKLESHLLEEKKRFQDYIDELKNLQQLFTQASNNIAQLFVCTKLAEKRCHTIEDIEMQTQRFSQADVKFLPSEELILSLKKTTHLGKASVISSRKNNLYEATHVSNMNLSEIGDNGERSGINSMYRDDVQGSCITEDTVIFIDNWNCKLKRYDVSTLSLIDHCKLPYESHGVCRVGDNEVAVACRDVVQLVSVQGKLSLTRSIKMKHRSYGIAHSNDKLYITDGNKSLYMYDMSGKLLKTITSDNGGQALFGCNNHIAFSEKMDRLFVGDNKKGLACFNADCEYIETITDPDVRPSGVCLDVYGNVIVVNCEEKTIVQCGRDGQKRGIIVNESYGSQTCVSIHHGLRKMFVCTRASRVDVYQLT